MRVVLDVIPCKLKSRLNVFVFIPTNAEFVDNSENSYLNPAPFFEECGVLVIVNTAEAQAAKKAIKEESEHSPV